MNKYFSKSGTITILILGALLVVLFTPALNKILVSTLTGGLGLGFTLIPIIGLFLLIAIIGSIIKGTVKHTSLDENNISPTNNPPTSPSTNKTLKNIILIVTYLLVSAFYFGVLRYGLLSKNPDQDLSLPLAMLATFLWMGFTITLLYYLVQKILNKISFFVRHKTITKIISTSIGIILIVAFQTTLASMLYGPTSPYVIEQGDNNLLRKALYEKNPAKCNTIQTPQIKYDCQRALGAPLQ